MQRYTKIITSALILVIVGFAALMWTNFHSMAIEDSYGDLQEIFYKAKSGDIIIDSNKRVGFIYKDSKRIFVEEDDCMKDLNNWASTKDAQFNLTVYRPEYFETYTSNPSYEVVMKLIKSQKLVPIVSIK
ncbi:hypothetical protein [Rufibacter sp. LB8]|uniref:hypothetical protein n=1 Tax=Rufibacter sp. LB8 TaxID=2777781 RepID=UPI00178C5D57|nr:hypothetical protein [Rufibacter sp. LB8]